VGIFDWAITMWLIIGIVFWLIMAIACAWLAKEKGRDWLKWGAIGILIGIIGLIILIASPSKKEQIDK